MDVEKGQARGAKRKADESNWTDDQRFAKRFNLLNLSNPHGHSTIHVTDRIADANGANSYAYLPVQSSQYDARPNATSADDNMQIDDTKDRVYISNLDAEIADIEANEPRERLIFLPDIEKHFSRIPHHVLAGNKTDPSDQQLVLYDVPTSITKEPAHASVRKAILEARRRAQEQAVERAKSVAGGLSTADGLNDEHDRYDAMEIE